MKKFFKRLSREQITWIIFIPFGAVSFYFNSWLGLLGAVFGWWLGGVLYRNEKAIRNYPYKKTFRRIWQRLGRRGFMLLCFIPFGVWSFYRGGWRYLLAAILGWGVGWLICKKIFKD